MLQAQQPRPPLSGHPDPIIGQGPWQAPHPADAEFPDGYYVLAHIRMQSGRVRHAAAHTPHPERFIARIGRRLPARAYRWSAATSLETLMYGRWLLEVQASFGGDVRTCSWFCPVCKAAASAVMVTETP